MKEGHAMSPTEKIVQELETLPPLLQEEALDFIGYLKVKQVQGVQEIKNWNRFSLNSAVRGMENDVFPDYQKSDLKEVWK